VEVVGDGEAEGLAVEFSGGGEIESLRGRIGVDALRVGGGFPHPVAPLALGGGWDVAGETWDAGDEDLVTVGLIDDVADAAMDGDNAWVAN